MCAFYRYGLAFLVLIFGVERTSAGVLTNPGAENGNTSGWVSTNSGGLGPFADNGAFNPGINPHTGIYAFVGGNGPLNTLTQNVSLLANGISDAAVDSGALIASVEFFAQGLNQGPTSDSPFIRLRFLDGANILIASVSTPEIDSHNLTWQKFNQSFSVPVGTRSIDYQMNFVRHVGSDNDAYVDDNSLTITNSVSTVPEPTAICIWSVAAMVALARFRRTSR